MTASTFIAIIGYVTGVIGGVVIIFSRVKNENIKDLRDRVEILEKERAEYKSLLEKEREESRTQHIANSKAIAKLEGQVELYKDLQLDSIANTNKRILEVLQNATVIPNAPTPAPQH